MTVRADNLDAAIVNARDALQSRIGENDREFIGRVYGGGLARYVQRLRAIGFLDCDNVLDAGCGYGQWSIALAAINRSVSGCDPSSLRIEFAQQVASELGVTHLSFRVGGVDVLPYDNGSFDAVFCYGVIFLTPWRQSLAEFRRVLRPGGKLYINANGIGWYVFLWQEEHNRTADYDPRAFAARTFTQTLGYDRFGITEPEMNLIIDPNELLEELKTLGFEVIGQGAEGTVHINPTAEAPAPFFRGEYSGQAGVYEVVATRDSLPE